MLTNEDIHQRLQTVMDPELNIDIVSLGLIYDIAVEKVSDNPDFKPVRDDQVYQVYIRMTLTTPGCPLAGVFDSLLKSSLTDIEDLNPDTDVNIELTFDPPWIPAMMTEEARAELGFD